MTQLEAAAMRRGELRVEADQLARRVRPDLAESEMGRDAAPLREPSAVRAAS